MRIRLLLPALAAALVAGSAVVFANLQDAKAAGCWDVDPYLDPEEVGFYLLLSQYRAENGLAPLSFSTNLTRAAAYHSENMGNQRFFGHDDPAGRSPEDRARQCGYAFPTGENIAAGTNWATARDAFEAWRNSPGHNANMLNPNYVQIGIGRYYAPGSPYGWYWATSFGTAYDGTNGSDIRIAESGIRQADLTPNAWNEAVVLPGGMRMKDVRGWTVWEPQPNGWWQQYGPTDYVRGGTKVGLLPLGWSLDKGRNPR
jgi:hypothetical protein